MTSVAKRKPNRTRCEAEFLDGSFMTLGPRAMVRCSNKPTVIATERKVAKGRRKRGRMSLCDDCRIVMIAQKGRTFARISKI